MSGAQFQIALDLAADLAMTGGVAALAFLKGHFCSLLGYC
jgi:hypothetical protein